MYKYHINFDLIIKYMIACLSPGIQSKKFLDINSLQHRFPQELKSIGFSVTLLHNHRHAQTGHKLLYSDDYRSAQYIDQKDAQKYTPCSWYLQSGEVIPYEFAKKKIDVDILLIKSQLQELHEKGYDHYGVTVRPIENFVEFETKEGHKYLERKEVKINPSWRESETAISGQIVDACYAYTSCVITSHYAHATDYGHDVN